MPDPSPRGRPAAPPPTRDRWELDVAREAARQVADSRARLPRDGDVGAIRRRVLAAAWEMFAGHEGPPTSQEAERYYRILAGHAVDWSDGRTRLDFLAEVARAIDGALAAGPGREAPTAHPGGWAADAGTGEAAGCPAAGSPRRQVPGPGDWPG